MSIALCNKQTTCDFEIEVDASDIRVECCKNCGRTVRYNLDSTGASSKQYLKDHLRDFCQPEGYTGKVFKKLYGKAG